MRIHLSWGAVSSLILLSNSLPAQTAGSISGYVIDSSRAAIPSAQVLAESAATGQRRRAVTDDLGHYSLPDMPIGLYVLKAEKDGFRTGLAAGVNLGIGETVAIDFQLVPGVLSEVVEVHGKIADVPP